MERPECEVHEQRAPRVEVWNGKTRDRGREPVNFSGAGAEELGGWGLESEPGLGRFETRAIYRVKLGSKSEAFGGCVLEPEELGSEIGGS